LKLGFIVSTKSIGPFSSYTNPKELNEAQSQNSTKQRVFPSSNTKSFNKQETAAAKAIGRVTSIAIEDRASAASELTNEQPPEMTNPPGRSQGD
jgi:hypothetical protein